MDENQSYEGIRQKLRDEWNDDICNSIKLKDASSTSDSVEKDGLNMAEEIPEHMSTSEVIGSYDYHHVQSDLDEESQGYENAQIRQFHDVKNPNRNIASTKNLLQFPKGPIVTHIRKWIAHIKDKKIKIKVNRIMNKFNKIRSLTKTHYETMFRHIELAVPLDDYFGRKIIFRDLMIAKKMRFQTKLDYLPYLDVFERAYRSEDKTFGSIRK